jgi:hypothetical protein
VCGTTITTDHTPLEEGDNGDTKTIEEVQLIFIAKENQSIIQGISTIIQQTTILVHEEHLAHANQVE